MLIILKKIPIDLYMLRKNVLSLQAEINVFNS